MTELSNLTALYEKKSAARAYTHWILANTVSRSPEEHEAQVMMRLGRSKHLELLRKGAVGAVVTTDTGVNSLAPLSSAWADLARAQTIIGKMGGATRAVPANLAISAVDVGVSAAFVAEGSPIPVARPTFASDTLAPCKLAVIVPFSRPMAERTSDQIAALIERDLSRAAAIGQDDAFMDGQAAVAGERPASVLYGLSPLGGGSPGNTEADVISLLATVRGGSDAVSLFFVTSPEGARYLLSARYADGQRLFPAVTATGGTIHGVPLLVTAGAPNNVLALIDANALLVVDEGIELTRSTATSFQFDSTPSSPATQVSLFQTNSVAIRLTRLIAWALAWTDGAAYINLPV